MRVADFGRDRDRKVSNRAASRVLVARREAAGSNSALSAVVAVCSGALAAKGRGRGVMRGPEVSLVAAVRAVYCGNVTELGGCLLVGRWSRVGEM